MRIPILKLKDVLDALLNWVKDNYNYYNDLNIPEQSWAYITFNGNIHGNFNYYTNLINLISRDDENPTKLETRLIFDSGRASLPTIHIHLPGESKGAFTPLNGSLGFGGVDDSNNTYEEKSSSSTATYELIITGANSEEIILIYELLYALFLAGHDTLQSYFETFHYSGNEIMANPDIIPYNTFYRSFKITIGQERIVRSIVLNPTVSNIYFNGKGVDPESPEDTPDPVPYPPESTDWFITNLKSSEEGGVIPEDQFTWLGAVKKSIASFIQKLVDKQYTHVTIVENPHPTNTIQTFTETLITGLKSDAVLGGEIPATIYNWFKSIYLSLVDSSVKSWIIGIVTILKDLATRIGIIEDKIIVEYVVPVDCYSVIINQDRHGNPLNLTGEIEFCRKSFVGCNNLSSNINTVYVNGIDSAIYIQNLNISGYNGINGRGGTAYSCNRHTINIENGSIYWRSNIETSNDISTTPTAFTHVGNSIKSLQVINSITSLELKDGLGVLLIKQGTIITLKKL